MNICDIYSYMDENDGASIADLQLFYGESYSEIKETLIHLSESGKIKLTDGLRYVRIEDEPVAAAEEQEKNRRTTRPVVLLRAIRSTSRQ